MSVTNGNRAGSENERQEEIVGWASVACLVVALASLVPLCIGFWMMTHYYGATCAVPFFATLVLACVAVVCSILARGEWSAVAVQMLSVGSVIAVIASCAAWIPQCWALANVVVPSIAVLSIIAGGIMWMKKKGGLAMWLMVIVMLVTIALPNFLEAQRKESRWGCPYKATEVAESALRALIKEGEILRYERGRVPVYCEGRGEEPRLEKLVCSYYNASYKIAWSIADGATGVTVSCRWNPEHWCSCSLRLSGTNLTERIMARRHGSEMYEWAHSCFPVDQLCSNTFERARGW